MMNALINLHRGYGLGDSVQMSAVLRHLAKYRLDWHIDYRNEHNVGRGLIANVLNYNEPIPDKHYDIEITIRLYDTWMNWSDRPNTRVSSCLREQFGLDWDHDCGRYVVNVSDSIGKWASDTIPDRSVAVHYQGDSSQAKKNLHQSQAEEILDYIERLGYTPYLLGRHIPKGYDAEVNCAMISKCVAFVGIDSGPAKCASATDTPALVVWTGHHPAPFHDPSPNMTHLVPEGYHGLEPVCSDPGVIAWFEEHYKVRQYAGDPVLEINRWLGETL